MTVNATDVIIGLPDLGTQIGDFIENMIPAVVTLAIVGAIVAGLVLIFKGIFSKVKMK